MNSSKLGIAITTYNRRDMLLAQIAALRQTTSCAFDLVVCDDGSSDGTIEAVRELGVTVIGGINRGIAWNKNRGLFYLREMIGSDVILLLDDDAYPTKPAWEQDWLQAVAEYGHINFSWLGAVGFSGAHTPEDPQISSRLRGQCIAFSRQVLSFVGYMDTRFGRYGHEHTDLTKRAIRAGFGGFIVEGAKRVRCFYSIQGGLKVLAAKSNVDEESIRLNGAILVLSEKEPVYRHAWRSEAEYETLRQEIDTAMGVLRQPPYEKTFARLEDARPLKPVNLSIGKVALQSSICRWSRAPDAVQDAGHALLGRPDGQAKFHTALEDMPWWQVDLGQAMTVNEIRIFNTTKPNMRERFRHFTIAIAFDQSSWITVFEKNDDTPVGGIDSAPFVWQPEYSAWCRFIRITLAGTGFLHLDHVEVFGPPPPAVATTAPPAEITNSALFDQFISLGDNCEFGLVQRAVEDEPLDLLRFGDTGDNETGLMLALRERFSAFATPGDLELADHNGEWIVTARRYGITFHTYKKTATTPLATISADEIKRLQFLARKIVEDLATSGKIFVRKSNKPVSDETMFEMHAAMRAYGAPVLLWVTVVDEQHPYPTVRRMAPGLLRGYIKRLAPYERAPDIRLEDWRELCLAAVQASR